MSGLGIETDRTTHLATADFISDLLSELDLIPNIRLFHHSSFFGLPGGRSSHETRPAYRDAEVSGDLERRKTEDGTCRDMAGYK